MMKEHVLIYGTTGYTGALIAEAAVTQGLRPIIAGRNPNKLAPFAERLSVTYRAFSFDDQISPHNSAIRNGS
ncbi:MAG: NAD(P)H-binding protein [Chloroflexi bacterium AL-W]|nr:NAD(P)H-binding protein [Chloroflexi bacterium AL-N1]NOK67993.1 NAD(P)H-binding protein [Chloroflexi bacterium AL-N10]NOK73333.1 NAD(P)H-binding protein [Chloroflexi bacterium AL-N5]NOK83247.1 NAD(P)H-binding protein [Chloroflexi bacterium AL-W]NOK87664.1 NAD(P)H-binding protein [Chloroflexi bacterium AL-N15]